jgi:hypothetical protein
MVHEASFGKGNILGTKFFIPKGKDYIFVSFLETQKSFLYNHHFSFDLAVLRKKSSHRTFFHTSPNFKSSFKNDSPTYKSPSIGLSFKSLSQVVPKSKSSGQSFYSVSFGFRDFISSTSFGSNNSCGELESSHGLDINFVVGQYNRHTLPQYFLSCFQIPFQVPLIPSLLKKLIPPSSLPALA